MTLNQTSWVRFFVLYYFLNNMQYLIIYLQYNSREYLRVIANSLFDPIIILRDVLVYPGNALSSASQPE